MKPTLSSISLGLGLAVLFLATGCQTVTTTHKQEIGVQSIRRPIRRKSRSCARSQPVPTCAWGRSEPSRGTKAWT